MAFAELIENLLEFTATSDDDAYAEYVQFKQQAKSRKVTVIKGVFVIPLGLNSHPILEVINVVGWRKRFFSIH